MKLKCMLILLAAIVHGEYFSQAIAKTPGSAALQDPTSPYVGADLLQSDSRGLPKTAPELTSILLGKQRKFAVVNGVIMGEGDVQKDVVLIKIYQDSVDVQMQSGVTRVYLDQGGMYKESGK